MNNEKCINQHENSHRLKTLDSRKRELVLMQLHKEKKAMDYDKSIKVYLRKSNVQSCLLSNSQEQIWLLDQLDPGNPAANVVLAYVCKNKIDINALSQSINLIIQRHESLRTHFNLIEDRLVQIVESNVQLTPHIINGTEDDKQIIIQQEIEAERRHRFCLAEPLLIRLKIIQISENENVIIFNLHNIIADRRSIGIITKEFFTFYDDFALNRVPSLEEPRVQYIDYAMWERKTLDDEKFLSSISYWKSHLKKPVPNLKLSSKQLSSLTRGNESAVKSILYPKYLISRLKKFSKNVDVGFYETLLAIFYLLLMRYTGEEDIAIGSPYENRIREEFEGAVGYFENMLVLRVTAERNISFRDFLQRVQSIVSDSRSRQIPYTKLVEEINPVRGKSQTSMFQVVFSYNSMPIETSTSVLLNDINQFPIQKQSSIYDLYVAFSETSDGLTANIEYSTSIFDEETIVLVAKHLERLMEGILENPNLSLTEIPLLLSEEKQKFNEWNNTDVSLNESAYIHKSFEQQATSNPEGIALVYKDSCWSYGKLNQSANVLANKLIRYGISSDTVVGVYLNRSPDALVGILGILKAGGAYLPLDPNYPQERIEYIVNTVQMPVLLTQQKLLSSIPKSLNCHIICIDQDIEINHSDKLNPDILINENQLAYVIFTSGSTGKPKGVMIEHRNIVNFFTGLNNTLSFDSKDTAIAITNISFDISVLELLWPLTRGAKIIIIPDDDNQYLDREIILHSIHQNEVTLMQCTPSLLRLIGIDSITCKALSKLRYLLLGGETLPITMVEQLNKELSIDIYNMYGPTETTVWSTSYLIDHKQYDSVPIGEPIANTRLYILDDNGSRVPIGIPGELYIAGTGVARGYWGQQSLTSERFIKDPFALNSNERMYKTGDLVRYLPDGSLEFLGRIDHQVKIRGHRIEMEEVSKAIEAHPDIAKCIVDAKVLVQDQISLIAYMIVSGDKKPSVEELRAYIENVLPHYMLPEAYLFLNEFPLTHNGKINREALPIPDDVPPTIQSEYDAPQTPLEKQIAEEWSAVLRRSDIGINDNFFALGGNSLSAVKLLNSVNDLFDIKLPLSQFFDGPTINQLSVKVVELQLANYIGKESGDFIEQIFNMSESEIEALLKM